MFRGDDAGGRISAGQHQGYLSGPISALELCTYIYVLNFDISIAF